MAATFNNKPVDVKTVGFPIQITMDQCIPTFYPRVVVSGTTHDAAFLENLIAMGGKEETIKGQRVVIFDKPTADDLRSLAKLRINRQCACPDESVNFSALDHFRMAVKIISLFLRTHSYPAFRDPTHLSDLSAWGIAREESKKRKRGGIDDVEDALERVVKRGPGVGLIEDEDTTMQDQEMTIADTLNEYLLVAKPSPVNPTPWGQRSDIPSHYGLFFPYVSDLAHYDGKTVPRVIHRYFLGCLGNSRETILKSYDTLKASWGNLGRTEIGKQLTHMYTLVDLALQAQGQLYPIYERGRYEGSVVLGYGYSVMVHHEIYQPMSNDRLKKVVTDEGGHTSILMKVLTTAGLKAQKISDVLNDNDFSMMKLRGLLVDAKLSESDRDKIKELAPLLSFSQAHLAFHDTSIATALSYIADNSWEGIPDNWPIHHSRLLSSDILEVVWSAFGFMAPTFMIDGGQLQKLSKKVYLAYDPNTKTNVVKNLDFIVSRLVTLDAAIADLKEVKKTQSIRLLLKGRRSGPNADRVFKDKRFTSILESLHRFAHVNGEEADMDNEGGRIVEILDMNDDDF